MLASESVVVSLVLLIVLSVIPSFEISESATPSWSEVRTPLFPSSAIFPIGVQYHWPARAKSGKKNMLEDYVKAIVEINLFLSWWGNWPIFSKNPVAHRISFLSVRAFAGVGTAVRNVAAVNSACLLDGEGGMVDEEAACVAWGCCFGLVKAIEVVCDHSEIKVPTSSAAWSGFVMAALWMCSSMKLSSATGMWSLIIAYMPIFIYFK